MSPASIHHGDDGSTGLPGKRRLPKYHPRLEALGDLDETSAALGFARALAQVPETRSIVKEIQRDLYTLMAEIAAEPENSEHTPSLDRSRLDWIEMQVGRRESEIPAARGFILPGDCLSGAAFSLARTITRRAERRVTGLIGRESAAREVILPYLNRLSWLCFLLELSENQAAGQATTLAKD
jgi:cob(I)alamin adenosyltransferase